jgi:hypothetical protein
MFFSNTVNANLSDIPIYNYSQTVIEQKSQIKKKWNQTRHSSMQIEQRIKIWWYIQSNSQIANKRIDVSINRIVWNMRRDDVSFFMFQKNAHHCIKEIKQKKYTNIKAYRFRILLNTLNKTFESIIIKRINNLTKEQNKSHNLKYEQRQNCYTVKHERNESLWPRFKKKLIHNLRKRKIPKWIIA